MGESLVPLSAQHKSGQLRAGTPIRKRNSPAEPEASTRVKFVAGQTAVMHGDEAGHYMFRHTFARPGHHIVRIFPSETEATSTFELDVEP